LGIPGLFLTLLLFPTADPKSDPGPERQQESPAPSPDASCDCGNGPFSPAIFQRVLHTELSESEAFLFMVVALEAGRGNPA
jgi:hypothetical protein